MYSGEDDGILLLQADAEEQERGLWYNLPLKFRLSALGALSNTNLTDAVRILEDWVAFSPDEPDAKEQLETLKSIKWVDNDPDFYSRAAVRREAVAKAEQERAAAEAEAARKAKQAYLRESQNVMGYFSSDFGVYTDAKTGEQTRMAGKVEKVYSPETRAKMRQYMGQARQHGAAANQHAEAADANAAAAARADEIASSGGPRYEFETEEDSDRYTDLVISATAAAIRATSGE
jgi:hypothetical protein